MVSTIRNVSDLLNKCRFPTVNLNLIDKPGSKQPKVKELKSKSDSAYKQKQVDSKRENTSKSIEDFQIQSNPNYPCRLESGSLLIIQTKSGIC